MIEKCDDVWWWGSCNNMIGWFPTSFIRLKVNQPTQTGTLTPKNLKSKHRSNIAKEILETERTYVRHLRGKYISKATVINYDQNVLSINMFRVFV